MPPLLLRRLQDFLDAQHIHYEVLDHHEAYTAPEVAHTLHVPGKMLAKVVMVSADGKLLMTVLPSTWQVDLARLQEVLGARYVRLASESEFKGLFPDCETGSMPPFGNLYGLDVYVDQCLTEDEEIVVQAGFHSRAVKLRYEDFARAVQPKVAEFHRAPAESAY
jgi:Ala-tRNA(Pro) deacylase